RRDAMPEHPSSRRRPSARQQPSAWRASSRLRPWAPRPSWWPSRPRRPRSSQPLVDLLNLDEVGDGLDVAARLRVVGADGGVTDPLETEAAQRVALVLLLAHLGLDLRDLEPGGHQ